MERDPFELLGVARTATEAEIISAYELLSVVFRPARWRDAPSEVRLEATRWSQALDQALRVALRTARTTPTRAQPIQ